MFLAMAFLLCLQLKVKVWSFQGKSVSSVNDESMRERGGAGVNDLKLSQEAQGAIVLLRQKYQRGVYRVIRDPEGVISFWAIEGLEQNPFSLQFANRGRISSNIADMPADFVRAFINFVRKTVRK
jgi:hypothetical protein